MKGKGAACKNLNLKFVMGSEVKNDRASRVKRNLKRVADILGSGIVEIKKNILEFKIIYKKIQPDPYLKQFKFSVLSI